MEILLKLVIAMLMKFNNFVLSPNILENNNHLQEIISATQKLGLDTYGTLV